MSSLNTTLLLPCQDLPEHGPAITLPGPAVSSLNTTLLSPCQDLPEHGLLSPCQDLLCHH